MNARIQVDSSGRVVIPKNVRDGMGLEAGAILDLEVRGDSIHLRPSRDRARMRKKKGIWVFAADRPMSSSLVAETLSGVRLEREARIGDGR